METPRPLQSAANQQDEITISRREYDDENVVTVDFGRGVEATLDVVGDTAIVVAGDRQFEFEIPDDATEVTTNDGMLIIRERSGTDEPYGADEPSETSEQSGAGEPSETDEPSGAGEKSETGE